MHLPLIVDNNGDLLIFSSLAEAETYMEPVDVLVNEYRAYDSVGLLLKLGLESTWMGNQRVRITETDESCETELLELLREYFRSAGSPFENLMSRELPELVREAQRQLST